MVRTSKLVNFSRISVSTENFYNRLGLTLIDEVQLLSRISFKHFSQRTTEIMPEPYDNNFRSYLSIQGVVFALRHFLYPAMDIFFLIMPT
jgi:hypothetical protein